MGILDFWKALFSSPKKEKKKARKKRVLKRKQGKVKKKYPKKSKKKPLKKPPKKLKKKSQKKKKRKTPTKTPKKIYKKPAKHKPKPSQKSKEKEIGIITHYFGKISVGIIKLKGELKVGDKIHIKGARDDFSQIIKSMQINLKDVSYANKGNEIGIKVKQRVRENDKVYKQ